MSQSSKLMQKYPQSKLRILKSTISSEILLIFSYTFCASIFKLSSKGSETLTTISHSAPEVGLLIILVAFPMFILYQWLYTNTYYYAFIEDSLVVKKGVLSTKEISLPFKKIQSVNTTQTIIERLFGLYKISVASLNSSSTIDTSIDGLRARNADNLRQDLIDVMGKH